MRCVLATFGIVRADAGRQSSVVMRSITAAAGLLFLAVALPGCARFSADARNQRAYAKYVQQSRAARDQQGAKIRQKQQEVPPQPEASEPVENISTEAAPSDG